MIAWLTDTFMYTGVLIAAVLLLRRPVTRHFGAQTAYMLWALPFLRLLLPPLVLPASLAPEPVNAALPALHLAQASGGAAFVAEPSVSAIDFASVALLIWLGGALAFLGWRIVTYRQMRRAVLADARPVGDVGRVRLVECPDVAAPFAFGVADKVVALPLFFMAQHDRQARDLAIAHELAHHRGHDLLANFAAQALLALHWFNPLAWYGWRAMRRDQEAACDARVLSGRCREDRLRYAALIATIATGAKAAQFRALAAPMACPVLGEASIIQRLKSLPMAEPSPRRRWAGRTMVAAGALALPLTASISYAAADVSAPTTRTQTRIITVNQTGGEGAQGGDVYTHVVRRDDGTTIILKTDHELTDAEAQQQVAEVAPLPPLPPLPPVPSVPPAPLVPNAPPAPPAPPALSVAGASGEVRQFVLRRVDAEQARAELGRAEAERARGFAQLEAEMERQFGERSEFQRMIARQFGDGSVDEAKIEASALAALKSARAAIAKASMPEDARAEALSEIDREIRRLGRAS